MLHRYAPVRVAAHAARRRRILAELTARGAAALIPTARPKARNADTEHRYRPDSDFWRLTGFGEPHSALVLLPALGERAARCVLFLRDSDRDQELWSGRRLGVARAAAMLGVDEARPIELLWKDLPALLEGCSKLCYRTGVDAPNDGEVLATLAKLRAKTRSNLPVPQELIDTAPVLHEARLVKDDAELASMRRAAFITAQAHLAALRETAPGANEREIEARIEYEFRRLGADAPAYNTIVAGGANACVLHYVDNELELRDGELLLIDAGAEFEHYACDVTRTFPVGARFSAEQRALYEVVLKAQLDAIECVAPGSSIDAVHQVALRALVEGLCALGLLRESAETALESGAYRRFYMHRTSHWLGLDVHDAGAYSLAGAPRPLAPGMVLTVEPGLYVAPDDDTVEERWRGIGIRIEDDVLVTAAGREVLTAAIPKGVAEVERLRAQALAAR
jgi:Xaa-Pro aminopeptidase